MQRERKRRLVYGLWGLVGGLILLGALSTFWAERWPPSLAHDQVLLVTWMGQQELLQVTTQQEGIADRRPWTGGNLIVVPGPGGLFAAGSTTLWRYSGGVRPELVELDRSDGSPKRSITLGQTTAEPVFTVDGRQVQLVETDERLAWIDLTTGARQAGTIPCHPLRSTLLAPLRRDEALLLCLWELWAVRPDGQRPLLTAEMGGDPARCERYAGRPFGVATDHNRKRLWLTGEGGLLCQIDPSTGTLRFVANLPIQESERVEMTDLQFAPATDLLYIGIHRWETDQVRRILVWDLQTNRPRAEFQVTDPIIAFRPTSDGGHLLALTAIRPGESATRLLVLEGATGKVVRELGQITGPVLDWAVIPE